MSDFSLWDLLLSMFWFMLLFAWIWMFIAILSDVFRDHELSGWAKALWTAFLVFLPWLGALVYLVVRGRSMNERAVAEARRREAAMQQYIRDTAASAPAAGSAASSTADELGKLADLRDRGILSPEEYEQAKSRALASV